MKNRNVISLFLAVLLACSAPQLHAAGFEWVVVFETNSVSSASAVRAMQDKVVTQLRGRLHSFGVKDYSIKPDQLNHIVIQVSGLKTEERDVIIRLISRRGLLEFRMVHEDSPKLVHQGVTPPGFEVLVEETIQPDGTRITRSYVVDTEPVRGLTGKYVKQASVQRHPVTDKPEIHFELDPEGTRIFEQITREYSPDGDRSWQLAIIVDGELYSAPVITGAIPGGRGSITGNFTMTEAVELANALGNSFETLVTIISEKVLDGPTETGLDGKSSVGFLTAPILIAFALAFVIFVVVIVVMILAARRQPAEQRRSSGTPPSSPPQ